MAHYVIGDIQGCFNEFRRLLNKIDFHYGRDTLWLAGDMINRGPKSADTLRFIIKHQDCMQVVLGNHDLHLLAVAYGKGRIRKNDTISDILKAKDCKKILSWLRQCPLMRQIQYNGQTFAMVHAGIHPLWTLQQAQSFADEVHYAISGKDYRTVFSQMYGSKPNFYDPKLNGIDRIRFIMNVMTRMRALTLDLHLDFDFKSTLNDMPDQLVPWFRVPHMRGNHSQILFGHWSALGLHQENSTICLDTGALWGGSLTAIELNSQKITQILAKNSKTRLK